MSEKLEKPKEEQVKNAFGKFIITIYSFLQQSLLIGNKTFLQRTKQYLDPHKFLIDEKRVNHEDLIYIEQELILYGKCLKNANYTFSDEKNFFTIKICEKIKKNIENDKVLMEIYMKFNKQMQNGEDGGMKSLRPEPKMSPPKPIVDRILNFFSKMKDIGRASFFQGSKRRPSKKLPRPSFTKKAARNRIIGQKLRIDDLCVSKDDLLKRFGKYSESFNFDVFFEEESSSNIFFQKSKKIKPNEMILLGYLTTMDYDGLLFDGILKREGGGGGDKKVLFHSYNSLKKNFEKFLQEIEVFLYFEINGIKHPHIVSFKGLSAVTKHVGIVTDFPENLDIQSFIYKTPTLSNYDRIRILYELCCSLKFLNASNPKIIHGFVRPQNVWIDKNMQVKLMNFQYSKIFVNETRRKNINQLIDIEKIRKEKYSSPELQKKGIVAENGIDQYAYGVICYEVCSNDFNQPKPPLITQVQELRVKNWMKDIIIGCLSEDVDSRPSFEQIYEEFLLNIVSEKEIIVIIKVFNHKETYDICIENFSVEGIKQAIKKEIFPMRDILTLYLSNDDGLKEITDDIAFTLENNSLIVVKYKPITVYFKTKDMKNIDAEDFDIRDFTLKGAKLSCCNSKEEWIDKEIHSMFIEVGGRLVEIKTDEDVTKLQQDEIIICEFVSGVKRDIVIYVRRRNQDDKDADDLILKDFSMKGLKGMINQHFDDKEIDKLSLLVGGNEKKLKSNKDVSSLEEDSLIIVDFKAIKIFLKTKDPKNMDNKLSSTKFSLKDFTMSCVKDLVKNASSKWKKKDIQSISIEFENRIIELNDNEDIERLKNNDIVIVTFKEKITKKRLFLSVKRWNQKDDEKSDLVLTNLTYSGLRNTINKFYDKKEILSLHYKRKNIDRVVLIKNDENVKNIKVESLVIVKFKPVMIFLKEKGKSIEKEISLRYYTLNEIQSFIRNSADWSKGGVVKSIRLQINERLIELKDDGDLEKVQKDDHLIFEFEDDKIIYFKFLNSTGKKKYKVISNDFTVSGLKNLIKNEFKNIIVKDMYVMDDNKKGKDDEKKKNKRVLLEKNDQIRDLQKNSVVLVDLKPMFIYIQTGENNKNKHVLRLFTIFELKKHVYSSKKVKNDIILSFFIEMEKNRNIVINNDVDLIRNIQTGDTLIVQFADSKKIEKIFEKQKMFTEKKDIIVKRNDVVGDAKLLTSSIMKLKKFQQILRRSFKPFQYLDSSFKNEINLFNLKKETKSFGENEMKNLKTRLQEIKEGVFRYEGKWKMNKFEGIGKLFSKKKSRFGFGYSYVLEYFGEFVKGKKHGKGRYVVVLDLYYLDNREFLTDGIRIKFYGKFEKGIRHGQGMEYFYNVDTDECKIKKGIWHDGKFTKKYGKTVEVPEYDITNFKKIFYSRKREDYKIGGGSFSEVYIIDDIYAFKIFNKVEGLKKKYVEKEINLLSNLSHKNILKVIGVSWEKNLIGIITEKCDKSVMDLILILSKGRMKLKDEASPLQIPYSEKVRIIYQTSVGMEYLHLNHILHRDLKWENILLTSLPYKVVKIADFGLSKINESFRMTKNDTFLGTPGYIAPEATDIEYGKGRKGVKYSYPADVFSFGMMMYELLFERTVASSFGEELFRYNLISAIKNGKRPDIPKCFCTSENKWLVDLIQLCWRENFKVRPTFSKIIQIILKEVTGNSELEKHVFSIAHEPSSFKHTPSYKKRAKLQESEEELKKKLLCKNCQKSRFTVVISKCGHLLCSNCVKLSKKKCCVCQTKVNDRIEISF